VVSFDVTCESLLNLLFVRLVLVAFVNQINQFVINQFVLYRRHSSVAMLLVMCRQKIFQMMFKNISVCVCMSVCVSMCLCVCLWL